MPLFMNLITGDTYDTTKLDCVSSGFCKVISCTDCPIYSRRDIGSCTQSPCQTWVNAHPEETARLMGYRLIKEEGESNMENYIVINGKKAELTPEQLEKLGIAVKEDPFERKMGETYYFGDSRGNVSKSRENSDYSDYIDLKRYAVANYCSDKELMEQRVLHETLSRLLWRYSMQHDGDKIDWNNQDIPKYYIEFNHINNQFGVGTLWFSHLEGVVLFYNQGIAISAIEQVVKPFMKEHPDFVW